MLIELNARTGGIVIAVLIIAGAVAFYQFGFASGSDALFMSQEFLTGAILGLSLALIILILASPEGIEPVLRSVTFLSVVLAALLVLYVLMVYLL